jgi:hypothetical protein
MSELASTVMNTTPVDLARTARIEAAEASAWADLYAAAPAEFAEAAGLSTREVAAARVLSWKASGRRYFSRVIGLGVTAPATEQALESILSGYQHAGITMFLVQLLPHCQPAQYEEWLRSSGLEPFDAQDRIVRGDEPLAAPPVAPAENDVAVERVTAETADEWAEFLQRVYRLDTGAWLPSLIGRPGWHQYVARRDEQIVAARAMHLGQQRIAWLGMDGPVPGLTTDDYAPDAAICAAIVTDGLLLGARGFIADIEAPAETMDTPAYEHFARLGFSRPYVRTHYARL